MQRAGARQWVILLLLVALSVGPTVLAQETQITFGIPWGLDVFDGVLLELVDEYNQQNPGVHVNIESGWGIDRLITGAAGGAGPDVIGFGGPGEVVSIGEAVLQPIDAMIERFGIDTSLFLPDSVTTMGGQTYALKMFVDPNFPLLYNETILLEAGINGPPATVTDFDEMFHKLTRRSSTGDVEQLAMLPWNLGEEHLFLTWGPTFGAYSVWEGDETSGRYHVNTDEWRTTFEWINGYYQQLLPDIAHWGDAAWWQLDWLFEGKLAMAYHVSPTLGRLQDVTPYTWKAAAPLSHPDGAEVPMWFGGFSFGIGKFTQHADAAYDFLEFITWDPRAAEIIGNAGLIGAYQGSVAHQVLLESNPEWTEFLSLLPRAFGNLYNPPQVSFSTAAVDFFTAVKEGSTVPGELAEMERRLNAQAAEAGILR